MARRGKLLLPYPTLYQGHSTSVNVSSQNVSNVHVGPDRHSFKDKKLILSLKAL